MTTAFPETEPEPETEPDPSADMPTDGLDPELAAELERLAQPRKVGEHAWTILLVSAVLWFGAASAQAAQLSFVLALGGVLVFHELGHLAAMKLFGYRNLQMLFLPFFGAAVTAQRHQASGAQQAIVALAGPVPGLVLGLALVLATDDPMLQNIGAIALLLNAINLLPMQPLDGGAFVHRVLFHRFPRAERLVDLVVGGLVAWFAVSTESWIFLAFVVITMVLSPFRHRLRAIARRIRAEHGLYDEELLEVPAPVRRRLAEEVRAAFTSASPAPKVLAGAMHNAWMGSSGRPASLGASIALLVVYALVLAPSAGLLWLMLVD
jgi:Zn-dependent protease